MTEFPDGLPTEAIAIIIDKIRGKGDAGNRKVALALWNVVGYAASQAIAEDKAIFENREISEEDFASILEQIVSHNEGNGPIGFGVIPWVLISKFAIKMLISIFL